MARRTLADLLARDEEEALAEREARSLYEHEHYCETAWLRHAERYDPEAQADMDLHDMQFPFGYRDDEARACNEDFR